MTMSTSGDFTESIVEQAALAYFSATLLTYLLPSETHVNAAELVAAGKLA